VQLGQHGLEPGWRVGCHCGLGKELGNLGGVSLADGVRDLGTQSRTRRVIFPAGTAVRQIALYCLLPGISRGWRVAGGLFEVMQKSPTFPWLGGVAEGIVAFNGSMQLQLGFIILL
jgi:hypothetical protein